MNGNLDDTDRLQAAWKDGLLRHLLERLTIALERIAFALEQRCG